MNPVKTLSKFAQEQKWLLFHRKSSGKDCDGRQVVDCLYQAAFDRFADTGGLAHYVHLLQSEVSLEVLAENLMGSAKFQAPPRVQPGGGSQIRHRDVSKRSRTRAGFQEPELLFGKGGQGATRANVLAAFAGSSEALDRHRRNLGVCLCQAAFGHRRRNGIRPSPLRTPIRVPVEVVAEHLVRSAEFQARHGRSGSVDPEIYLGFVSR
jgi:hypothetical protein